MFASFLFTVALLIADTAANAVSAVYPSGSTISAHTLRLSIHFTSPQYLAVLGRLSLRGKENRPITAAFLNQELWSPDRTKLTILLDPARLKTHLERQKTMGAPLAGRHEVALFLDDHPIKSWTVTPHTCRPISLDEWQVSTPRRGGTSPLKLRFPEPIDIQALHLIAVLDPDDQRILGEESITTSERDWKFKPLTPWKPGLYHIVVHPDFENPCGDEIGDLFEHVTGKALQPQRTRTFRIVE